MPSATYFFSTAKKSKQKMPLAQVPREAGTAQIALVVAQYNGPTWAGCFTNIVLMGTVRCARWCFVNYLADAKHKKDLLHA